MAATHRPAALATLLCTGLSALLPAAVTGGEAEGGALEGVPELMDLAVHGNEPGLVTVTRRADGSRVFEGDILVPDRKRNPVTGDARSFGVKLAGKLWPDGRLPYVIDSSVASAEREKIADAIAHWHERTAIRIVPRSTETDYVVFKNAAGCASHVGRIGRDQAINVSSRCSVGNLIHEIGHALGLYHEHSRPDRDTWITVNWDNIAKAHQHNFLIVEKDTQLPTHYDYGSIMHYGSTFFSTNGSATLLAKQPGAQIGQRQELSDADVAGIRRLYGQGFVLDLALSPEQPLIDTAVTLSLQVNNVDNRPLQALAATVSLPPGVGVQSSAAAPWQCTQTSGDTLNCNGGDLAADRSSTLALSLRAPSAPAPLTVAVRVSAQDADGMQTTQDLQRSVQVVASNSAPSLAVGQSIAVAVPLDKPTDTGDPLEAHDPNGDPISTYRLIDSSHPGWFDIDARRGNLIALDLAAINAARGETVDLRVAVSDGTAESAPILVQVFLVDQGALISAGGGGSGSGSGGGGGGGGGAASALFLLALAAGRRSRPALSSRQRPPTASHDRADDQCRRGLR